jgi:hypothetical protein
MKVFILIFGLISFSFGLRAQIKDGFICGNGKFGIHLHEATLTADSLVKRGKHKEAVLLLLPFALDTKFGENSASPYVARLIKKIYTHQEIEKELKKAMESIKVQKQMGPYGEIQMLQMTYFGQELDLPDFYYWLGSPPNKSTVSRRQIDASVSIVKTRKMIDSSLLFLELRS